MCVCVCVCVCVYIAGSLVYDLTLKYQFLYEEWPLALVLQISYVESLLDSGVIIGVELSSCWTSLIPNS